MTRDGRMSPELTSDISRILKNLGPLLEELHNHFSPEKPMRQALHKYGINPSSLDTLDDSCYICSLKLIRHFVDVTEDRETMVALKRFIDSSLTNLQIQMDRFLGYLHHYMVGRDSALDRWDKDKEAFIIFGDYLIFSRFFRKLKSLVSSWLIRDYSPSRELSINERSPLFNVAGMKHYEFSSNMGRLKEYAKDVCVNLPNKGVDKQLLQQQVMEIIKNAVRHGNEKEITKKVRIWFKSTPEFARIVVEDEGEGFQRLEEWNAFFRERNQAINNNDMDKVLQYTMFSHEKSEDNDGGNALLSAVEYWDSGLVYNTTRNKVAAIKYVF